MDVYYQNHPFRFEQSIHDPLEGRLLLDQAQRDILASLLETEDEAWYLGPEGQRLPANQLFSLSPWSFLAKTGRVKLLCRFINISNGSVMFNTEEDYTGDTSGWTRASAP